jgi:hypothetical protein
MLSRGTETGTARALRLVIRCLVPQDVAAGRARRCHSEALRDGDLAGAGSDGDAGGLARVREPGLDALAADHYGAADTDPRVTVSGPGSRGGPAVPARTPRSRCWADWGTGQATVRTRLPLARMWATGRPRSAPGPRAETHLMSSSSSASTTPGPHEPVQARDRRSPSDPARSRAANRHGLISLPAGQVRLAGCGARAVLAVRVPRNWRAWGLTSCCVGGHWRHRRAASGTGCARPAGCQLCRGHRSCCGRPRAGGAS